jgi:hypothetical protein
VSAIDEYNTRLNANVKAAREQIAKTAIANPGTQQLWNALSHAISQRKHWEKEEARLRGAWGALISSAPPEWQKLAPKEPS